MQNEVTIAFKGAGWRGIMAGKLQEQIKEHIKNSSMQLLVFNSLLIIEIVAVLGIVIIEACMNYEEKGLFVLLLLLIYLIAMFALGNMYPQNINVFTAVILLPINFAVFPYMLIFAEGGGIKSGMPVWMTFGLILVFIALDGKLFWGMLIATVSVDVALLAYTYMHENLVQVVDNTFYYYEDNAIAILAVSCSIGIILKYQRKLDAKQNEKIQKAVIIAEQEKKKAMNANTAKSSFLAYMSHDIRTPMNAITGMTELAKYHIDDPQKVKECLDKIQSSSEQLLYLINNVLDMSEIETKELHLKTGNFNMTELIENVQAVLSQIAIRKKINFQIHMEEIEHTNLIGDAGRLRQVFMNLIGNSLKFTEAGGRVDFTIQQMHNNLDDFAMYTFIIEDTGIGMSKDFVENELFQPFTRGEGQHVNNAEGSGLGMSITKNILDAMGAKLTVTSEVGKGSKFVIQIKFPINQSEQLQTDEDGNVKLLAEGKNILVVEDNEINMEIILNLLERTHANVISVYDGESAIEAVKKQKEGYFDLILMDIQLPGIDGYQAARAIRCLPREDTLSVPMIAMTANAFSQDVEKTRDNGMNAHVTKPIDVKELYAKMYYYLYHN